MHPFLQLKIRPWGLLGAAGGLVWLASLTGFAGAWWWVFDLTAHFRLQYLASLFVLTALFCIGKRFRVAAVMFAGAIVNLAVMAPYYLSASDPAPTPNGQPVRALLVNVHTANQRFDLVRALIRSADPDVVVLEELDQRWMKELSDIQGAFPHSKIETREDNFGIALLSKWPLPQAEIIEPGNAEAPSVLAQMDINGRRLWVLGTHPVPPGSRINSWYRNEQLAALPEVLRQREGSKVILGDLNVTPWSVYFRRLLRETGLRDSAQGHGVQGTWPSYCWPIRIPIDHCLLSSDLRGIRRQVGPSVGSDHFPLLVEFMLP